MKRIVAFLMSVVLLACNGMVAKAAEPMNKVEYILQQDMSKIDMDDLEQLNVEELNELIHELVNSQSRNTYALVPTPVNRETAKLAWLSAAAIARKAGYPCAATIVEHSVLGKDYVETNGSMASVIKTTRAFNNWKKNTSLGNIVFTKDDNKDLFYAFRGVGIKLNGNSTGARAIITDRFDFRFETDLSDLFTTLVNDAGLLFQWAGVLEEINIKITVSL